MHGRCNLDAPPRDGVRRHRYNELVSVAVRMAGVHPERDAVDPGQAETRDVGEVRHG